MLTKTQLRTCALFLRHASASAQWVAMTFFADGDGVTAARLNDLVNRLSDEAKAIDAMIPSAPQP